jgi:hypothetical protein
MGKKRTLLDRILGRDRTLPTSEELAAHAHYYFSCHHHGGNRVEVTEEVNGYEYKIIRTQIERKAQS